MRNYRPIKEMVQLKTAVVSKMLPNRNMSVA
jgi:hypothetical protein